MKTILIINGPNLNMLGKREPEIYGKETLDDIKNLCETKAKSLSFAINFYQSNNEGEIIDLIQKSENTASGIIINPAGLGHSSVALMDSLLATSIPSIEVHLSNIYKREEFRHHTYTSKAVKGVISGFGSFGYIMALEAIAREIK
ncbi:MAG: type II 3-dehydroquinate dehydratase [Pseudomonadota bacterium]